MRTMPLGDTGLEVSAMCLGAMLFGTRTDEATSFRLLDSYREAGGNFIDTANIYAAWMDGAEGGESEELLGRWLKQAGERDSLVIATKMGSRLQPSGRGLRPEQIREECDKSLARMGIETIDLYYAHFHDPVTSVEVSLEAFDALRKQGKVRFLGASNHPAWRLAEANTLAAARSWAGYCCVQQRLSYLQPAPDADFGVQVAANRDLFDYCRERNVTLVAYSPLLGGIYGRDDKSLDQRYNTPRNAQRLETVRQLAAERGVDPNPLVLAWMLHHDPPILPIFAASTEAQLHQNLAALDIRLSEAEMQRLNEAGCSTAGDG